MALSLTQDGGIHHLRIETDKHGMNPALHCWCGKCLLLDFAWGVKRFSRSLNNFLIQHEQCLPIGEPTSQPVPKYKRGDRVNCATQGVTFTGKIAQLTRGETTTVYHIEAETPNNKTTPVFVEECEIVGLVTEEEQSR